MKRLFLCALLWAASGLCAAAQEPQAPARAQTGKPPLASPEVLPPGGGAEAAVQAFTSGARVAVKEARPHRRSLRGSRSGIPAGLRRGRQLRVVSYAYCLGGRTASGAPTQPGAVAVDPRVIPLGTRLYIPGYGWGRALDTGGAIQGHTIDVWFPSSSQCYQWGIRDITITVVDD